MPEGPSIAILREQTSAFEGQVIAKVEGNTTIEKKRLLGPEVLFRIRVHPLCTVGALPPKRLNQLVAQARQYSFDFYEWKKQYVLRKHWLAHAKRVCPRCDIPFVKAHLGQTMRRSFFCENCQKKYT